MAAAPSDTFPPAGGWTAEDLDAMPEDGRRRELLDGVLIMSATRTAAYQTTAGQLMAALYESCPDGYDVTPGGRDPLRSTAGFHPGCAGHHGRRREAAHPLVPPARGGAGGGDRLADLPGDGPDRPRHL